MRIRFGLCIDFSLMLRFKVMLSFSFRVIVRCG